MTTPDWDPTMPLTWGKMEFLGRPQPVLNQGHYEFDIQVPSDRSGHHVLWIAWQRDDPVGEVFVSTSDVMVMPPTMVAFCDPADLNSIGLPTVLGGNLGLSTGSGLHLEASQGPPTQFGYFLVGTTFVDPGTPLGQGHLCLDTTSPIGRYNVPGGALNSLGQFDSQGVLQNISATSVQGSGFDVPQLLPSSVGSITSGSTWHFQLWHREDGGQSNLSNGLSVTFP